MLAQCQVFFSVFFNELAKLLAKLDLLSQKADIPQTSTGLEKCTSQVLPSKFGKFNSPVQVIFRHNHVRLPPVLGYHATHLGYLHPRGQYIYHRDEVIQAGLSYPNPGF